MMFYLCHKPKKNLYILHNMFLFRYFLSSMSYSWNTYHCLQNDVSSKSGL